MVFSQGSSSSSSIAYDYTKTYSKNISRYILTEDAIVSSVDYPFYVNGGSATDIKTNIDTGGHRPVANHFYFALCKKGDVLISYWVVKGFSASNGLVITITPVRK